MNGIHDQVICLICSSFRGPIGGLLIYYYCNISWGGESATTTHHGDSKAKEEGSIFIANQINNTVIPLGDVVGF